MQDLKCFLGIILRGISDNVGLKSLLVKAVNWFGGVKVTLITDLIYSRVSSSSAGRSLSCKGIS